MNFDEHYKKHASRKFLFVMVALLFSSVLAYIGKVEAVVYRDIVIALMGVYTAGNVWQKYIEKVSQDEKK